MRTFRPPFPLILTLVLILSGPIGWSQTAKGGLFFWDDSPGSQGVYRLDYPSLQLQQIDTVQVSDITLDEENLFTARGNHWDSTGLDRYDLHSLLKIDSLRGIRALRISIWEDFLLLVSLDQPYVRILDPHNQWHTVFVLDSTKAPFPPAAILTDGPLAYLMEAQSVLVVDLTLQDTLLRVPTPHPYPNQNQNGYLAQSENDLWIGVQYATGAIRSSLLRLSKDSLKVRTAFHNEGNDFWGPPVPSFDQLHVFGFPSYYDILLDTLIYSQGNYPYVVAADSSALFVWDPGQDSLFTYSQGQVTSNFSYSGNILDAQFQAPPSGQAIDKTDLFGLTLFPNPAPGSVWLKWKEPQEGWCFTWLDLAGRILSNGRLPRQKQVKLEMPRVEGLLILQLLGPNQERLGFRVMNRL